jgi:hypothetical protein
MGEWVTPFPSFPILTKPKPRNKMSHFGFNFPLPNDPFGVMESHKRREHTDEKKKGRKQKTSSIRKVD